MRPSTLHTSCDRKARINNMAATQLLQSKREEQYVRNVHYMNLSLRARTSLHFYNDNHDDLAVVTLNTGAKLTNGS